MKRKEILECEAIVFILFVEKKGKERKSKRGGELGGGRRVSGIYIYIYIYI